MRALLVIVAAAGCSDRPSNPCNTSRPAGTAATTPLDCHDAMVCAAPSEVCGELCVDLASDQRNCGVCARNCGTAACNAGRCAIETVATGLYAPGLLESAVFAEGKVGFCSTPAARVTVGSYSVSIQDQCPISLTVAESGAYIGRLGEIARHTNSATPTGTIDTMGQQVTGIATYGSSLYYGTHDGVFVAGLPGAPGLTGTRIHTTASRTVRDIIVTPTRVWFETSADASATRQIDVIDLSGSGHVAAVSTVEQDASFAYDGQSAFVAEAGGQGRLLRMHDSGSYIGVIVEASAGIIDIAADDIALYWAERLSPTTSRIWMRRHDSAGLDEILADDQPLIRHIAVARPHLYWITEADDATGALYRVVVR